MLIYRRFYLAYITHTPYADIPTPVSNRKTRIRPQNQKKNMKIPKFPQIRLISISVYVNVGNYKAGFQQPNIANPIFLQFVYELGTFSNFS